MLVDISIVIFLVFSHSGHSTSSGGVEERLLISTKKDSKVRLMNLSILGCVLKLRERG